MLKHQFEQKNLIKINIKNKIYNTNIMKNKNENNTYKNHELINSIHEKNSIQSSPKNNNTNKNNKAKKKILIMK